MRALALGLGLLAYCFVAVCALEILGGGWRWGIRGGDLVFRRVAL